MTKVEAFQALAQDLQRDLAFTEMTFPRGTGSESRRPALMVLRLRDLKLKMYQEKRHALPHLHVDYGKKHHVASFSIEPTRCVEGYLDRDVYVTVESWIEKNKEGLLVLWRTLQTGGDAHLVVAELFGNEG